MLTIGGMPISFLDGVIPGMMITIMDMDGIGRGIIAISAGAITTAGIMVGIMHGVTIMAGDILMIIGMAGVLIIITIITIITIIGVWGMVRTMHITTVLESIDIHTLTGTERRVET